MKNIKYKIFAIILLSILINAFSTIILAYNNESTNNSNLDDKSINSEIKEKVQYRTHVQNIGWQNYVQDGVTAGTEGKSLRLEGINIKLSNNLNIKYQVHIQNIGWQSWKKNGEMAGTEGKSLRLEAIKICLEDSDDYSIMYRVHVQNVGWQEWKTDEEIAGTTGQALRLEAIQIKIVPKDKNLHVKYKSHVQNVGWQGYVMDGQMSGTSGKSYRVEAINISLINAQSNAKILYRTHVQNIGWQNWKSNGEMAGTTEQALRIEAIEIKLQNMENYTVEYQVYIQDKGWSAWYIDGEMAGTVGQSKRIEAIKIRIVPHYKRNYKGIDVSQYNGTINWNFVKKDNIDFAFIRVGFRGYGQEGNFAEDIMFKRNIEAAKQAGIPIGVYFVTQAITEAEAIEEANWVLQKIKKYDIEYPIAIDIEEAAVKAGEIPRTQNLDKSTRTRLAKLFCQTIKNAGYTPIVYTNVDWATNKLNISELSQYDTWIAHYKYDVTAKPNYNGAYTIWQYSDKGSINGILGNVDLNICYKKY